MANNKNPKPSTEDAMAAVSALIAKAKREGSIQSSVLFPDLNIVFGNHNYNRAVNKFRHSDIE